MLTPSDNWSVAEVIREFEWRTHQYGVDGLPFIRLVLGLLERYPEEDFEYTHEELEKEKELLQEEINQLETKVDELKEALAERDRQIAELQEKIPRLIKDIFS